jgi:hypothetical protein
MKINYTKQFNEAQKSTLKEEFLQIIKENFIEMILDMAMPNCTGDTQKIPRQQK